MTLGNACLPVTFNVVDTGRFKLGFLLGMDVLERYHFCLDVSNRKVTFDDVVYPIDGILEARKYREQQLLSAQGSQVFSVSENEESDVGRQQQAGLSVGQRMVRVFADQQADQQACRPSPSSWSRGCSPTTSIRRS